MKKVILACIGILALAARIGLSACGGSGYHSATGHAGPVRPGHRAAAARVHMLTKRQRTSRFTSLIAPIAAAVLASVILVTVAPAGASTASTGSTAGPGQPCPSDFQAATASIAVLTACGIASYYISSTTRLADSGTMTSYDGSSVAILTPPPGFSPATASASELSQYGIPSAPLPTPLEERFG